MLVIGSPADRKQLNSQPQVEAIASLVATTSGSKTLASMESPSDIQCLTATSHRVPGSLLGLKLKTQTLQETLKASTVASNLVKSIKLPWLPLMLRPSKELELTTMTGMVSQEPSGAMELQLSKMKGKMLSQNAQDKPPNLPGRR